MKTLIIGFDAKGAASVLAQGADAAKAWAGYKQTGKLPAGIVRAEKWDRDHGKQAVAVPTAKPQPKIETKGSK
jgi:hypothetical protein